MIWLIRLLTSRLAGPIASGIAAVLAIGLALILISKNATIAGLDRQINDPHTGYAVRLQLAQADLVQCRANRLTLEESTRLQNEAIDAASREGAARLADLNHVASVARQQATAAQAHAAEILSRRGTGNDCADADALILGEAR